MDKNREFKKLLKKLNKNLEENIELQKELKYMLEFIDYDIEDLDITVNEPEELDIYKFKGQHNFEYIFNFNIEEALKQQQSRSRSIDNINREIDVKRDIDKK